MIGSLDIKVKALAIDPARLYLHVDGRHVLLGACPLAQSCRVNSEKSFKGFCYCDM
jgi:hypothetical protein